MYELLIISFVVGFVNGGLTCLIDFCMTKGHILDFVRERAAKHHARKAGIEDLFEHIPEYDTWQDRADVYNQLYWNIAKERKIFTRWICPYCMSGYTFFPVLVFLLWGLGTFTVLGLLTVILISLVINYTTIRWLA